MVVFYNFHILNKIGFLLFSISYILHQIDVWIIFRSVVLEHMHSAKGNYTTNGEILYSHALCAKYNNKHCTICLDGFTENDSYIIRCGHRFHLHCLQNHQNKNGFLNEYDQDTYAKCPNCNAIFNSRSQVHKYNKYINLFTAGIIIDVDKFVMFSPTIYNIKLDIISLPVLALIRFILFAHNKYNRTSLKNAIHTEKVSPVLLL
eukprot:202511_1